MSLSGNILISKNQLNLYGYESYFDHFVKIFKDNYLSKTILLSGSKGIGKATFAYHFINFLLSQGENQSYSLKNYEINSDNKSYKLTSNNIHPNLFLLENEVSNQSVKMEQTRNLLNFLSKSTYKENLKIVLIDNADVLSLNSSNALLKAIEEPNNNTFFFIIQSDSSRILKTIKSRCMEFKFFFNHNQKREILERLIGLYNLNFDLNKLTDNLYFDTPGNILKYLFIFKDTDFNFSRDALQCIFYLIENLKLHKDVEYLNIISLFVEIFYHNMMLINKKKINYYLLNKQRILKEIDNIKKFNLDKKNFIISLKSILENEK